MKKTFKPIDLSRVKTYSLSERKSRVATSDFAKTWQKGCNFKEFFNCLPDVLAGAHIKAVITSMATAYNNKKHR